MTLLSSLRIIPGVRVCRGEDKYLVLDLISSTKVLVESEEGEQHVFDASDFVPDLKTTSSDIPDLTRIQERHWKRAFEIYTLIQPLVELGRKRRTREDVERVAASINKHPATVYRWLRDYESTGLISSLLRQKRKDQGQKRLDARVEKIIEDTIETFYLNKQKRSPNKTGEEIRKICIEQGLPPPDLSTVRKRIYAISGELRVRKRDGAKAADEQYEPIRGHFPGADFPLAVIQIDHTPMDVIIVDDVHRRPIGRPFLTSGIDVLSKMMAGFYISLDHPGALATGMCISRCILSKEVFLASLGIDDLEWPCWGVMRTVHTDNAMEFRGTMLGKAAKEYGIIPERRPKGRPKYGGHVERAFRTFMAEIHNEIPGTTFSNVKEKLDYDSEGHAIMTLSALEKWFTIFILGVYHQKPHSGNNGLPPIVKWERSIYSTDDEIRCTGIPMRVPDEERLKLDFMPYFERTVQEYGIINKGISYYTDALRGLIHMRDPKSHKLKQKFVCRYDPRDLSRLWLFEPESNKYTEVPYRDRSRPPISLWELKEAQRMLREQSLSATNEELIFKTIDQMRAIVKEESKKTKKARRMQQRQKQWEATQKENQKSKNIKQEVKEDIRDEEPDIADFEPFTDIRES